jgi:hypothetical protein
MNGPENLIDAPLDAARLPEVVNHTTLPSQYFQMADVNDCIFHVVVVRSTYDMYRADNGGRLLLAREQTPLVESDQYYEEVNSSSLIQESDYAPFKPKCDLLFTHANACAPDGRPITRIPVGVRVGEWSKMLHACGPRKLRLGLFNWSLSEPIPTTQVPIRYELAWGGTCQWPSQVEEGVSPELLERYDLNPVGRGFLDRTWLRKSGAAEFDAPQLEAFEKPLNISHVDARNYPVIGLGAVGRWWLPRRTKAGTFDETWKRERWPRLPKDFDFNYWNCAPSDQQIDYPLGGEQVVMAGLHPGGEMRFRLPQPESKLLLHLDVGVPMFKTMQIDTLVFDLRAMQLIVVQRALVAAKAGVERIEIGTWDYHEARARNNDITKANAAKF